MLRFAFIAVALAFVGAASASDYVYRDGYYWHGSTPYTRQLVQTPGYWSCGRYVAGQTYYQYTQAAYTPHAAKLPDYRDPNALSKLLDIAAERSKAQSALLKDRADYDNFANAVKLLGLEGNFRYPSVDPFARMPYASGTALIGPNGYVIDGHAYQHFGAQASTVYGYSQLANVYSPDLNQLYLQAAQLTQSSINAGQTANQGFQALVTDQAAAQAKVEELKAKREFAMAMLQSLSSEPKLAAQGVQFRITPQGAFEAKTDQATPEQVQALRKEFTAVKTQLCASCHSGAKKAGGFDIASWSSLSPADRDRIIMERLTTADESKRMPRTKDGRPGPKVEGRNLLLFQMNP